MRAENNCEYILINILGTTRNTEIHSSLVTATLQPSLLPTQDSAKAPLLLGAARRSCPCNGLSVMPSRVYPIFQRERSRERGMEKGKEGRRERKEGGRERKRKGRKENGRGRKRGRRPKPCPSLNSTESCFTGFMAQPSLSIPSKNKTN